jgi:hypothetical protein
LAASEENRYDRLIRANGQNIKLWNLTFGKLGANWKNLFCFFSHPQEENVNPTHIAHIGKSPRANAPTNALPKSAILPTHP